MSNYTPSTDFAAKDSLLSGNPNKIVKGTEITAELTSISAAVATKADANSADAFQAGATTLGATTASSLNSTPIGNSVPSTGAFTTLSATGNTTLGDASTDTVTVNGYMGVGGAAVSYAGLYTASTALAGADQSGIYSYVTGTSAATGSVRGVQARGATAAASFTSANVGAFWAADAVKGAGSTITNQHGVYIADQTQGTNNYGLTSLVSSGANKWNVYASGTAANYFAGNVGIGATTVNRPLHINATGTTGTQVLVQSGSAAGIQLKSDAGKEFEIQSNSASALIVYDRTATAERLRIDSAGNLGLGVTPSERLHVAGGALITGGAGSFNYNGVSIDYSGTTGRIAVGNTAAAGAELAIYTASTGGNELERMRIDSAGNLGIGVTPSAWLGAGYQQFPGNGFIGNAAAYSSNTLISGVNAYYDVSWKYKATGVALRYDQNSSGNHVWYTAPSGTAGNAITFTQALAVGNGTTLALEGATSAAGTGIAFPATQLASSNANTLDDYEEGTWTPAFSGTGSSFTYAANGQAGFYTKVGNLVTVTARIQLSTSGVSLGAGAITITGLPFTSGSATYNTAAADSYWFSITTSLVALKNQIGPSSSSVNLYKLTAAAAASTTTFVGTDLHATNGCGIGFTMSYFV